MSRYIDQAGRLILPMEQAVALHLRGTGVMKIVALMAPSYPTLRKAADHFEAGPGRPSSLHRMPRR